jgi:DNA invertase Pin-like site-specific DNA recombinase
MIFGYARVSTQEQNLDTQLHLLQQAGCQEIYQEKISGVATHRPELERLLAQLREGDTVVVARFFRLGRNRDHVIKLVNSFAQKGVHFKALDIGIDTSTPAGKLVLGYPSKSGPNRK